MTPGKLGRWNVGVVLRRIEPAELLAVVIEPERRSR